MAHLHIAVLPLLLLLLTFGNTINAGITRQLDTALPIRERITRSVGSNVEEDTKTLETIPTEEDKTYSTHRHLDRSERSPIRITREATNPDDLQTAEDIVFRPLFRHRVNHKRLRRSAAADDMQTAENGLVFKPLFRKRHNLRRLRREAPTSADMQTAENGLVFRPLFRKRQNIRRFRRDAPEDMQTAENNIVFRPLFRRKPIRKVRSADNDFEAPESGTGVNNYPDERRDEPENGEYSGQDGGLAQEAEISRIRRDTGEVMDTAANTIVFRPLFRSHRRNFNRRGNYNYN